MIFTITTKNVNKKTKLTSKYSKIILFHLLKQGWRLILSHWVFFIINYIQIATSRPNPTINESVRSKNRSINLRRPWSTSCAPSSCLLGACPVRHEGFHFSLNSCEPRPSSCLADLVQHFRLLSIAFLFVFAVSLVDTPFYPAGSPFCPSVAESCLRLSYSYPYLYPTLECTCFPLFDLRINYWITTMPLELKILKSDQNHYNNA